MSALGSEDPYYLTDAAQWVLRRVTGTGVEVDVVDNLQVPCYSSRSDGHLWIRSGLPFAQYHWAMAKGIIHQLFGPQVPPEAPAEQDARLVARGAVVVPLQRPPYSSGTWRH